MADLRSRTIHLDSSPYGFTFGEENLPRRFGRYLLLRRLGRGGMGVVYEAEDLELQRFVALKMPRFDTDEDRRRFQNETRLLARAKHPNIVDIYDAGDIDGRCYFTMPFMKGGSLSEPARKELYAANPGEAARLVSLLARAVHHAHLQSVYHRDLKPGNILFDDDDRPYIGDFGLAKDMLGEGLSATTGPRGTAQYMAPEQLRGAKKPDWPRIDVYGLGAILYEILTRSPPHEGDSTQEVYRKVLHEEPGFHPRRRSRRDIETICLQCLRKEPEKRYATALEVAEDLDRYLNGKRIRARSTPPHERFWKLARRHPAWTAVIVCALVGLAGYGYSEHRRSVEREEMLAREQAENRRSRSLLYAHRMREACQDLEARRFDKMAGLMWSLSEPSGEVEDRDFEFLHAAKRASQMIVGLPGLTGPVRSISLSSDGVANFLRDSDKVHALCDDDFCHRDWEKDVTPSGFLALLPREKVAAGHEDTIKVWDACTGELLEEFGVTGHQTAGAYGPGGELCMGGADGAIHVRNPGSPYSMKAMPAHDGPVLSIVFLGNSGSFATCGQDGRVLFWRGCGEGPTELSAAEPILALAASPDGNRLAGAGAKGTVHVWSRKESCAEPVRVNVSEAALRGIAISPDGRLIAAGGDDRFVHILRVTRGEGTGIPEVRPIRKLDRPNKEILCLAFTHDGKRLITGAGDGGLAWDMTEIEENQAHDEPVNLDPGKSAVTGAAFRPEGDRFYTAHEDLTLREWIVTGKSRKARVRPGRAETFSGDRDAGIMLSPDARWVVVNTGAEELSIWSVEKDCVPFLAVRSQTLGDAGSMRAATFSRDSMVLATIGPGDDLRTWRLDGDYWVFERKWPHPSSTRRHSGAFTLALSATGAFAAVSGKRSGEIAVWSLDERAAPPELFYYNDQSVLSLAFTPDERFLLVGGTAAQLDFLHLETLLSGKQLPYWQGRILRHHESAIVSIGFTRMGNPVSAGANGELIFWRYHLVEDGKIAGGSAARFGDSASPIAAIAFSASNEFMVTGGASRDGPADLRLWRTFTRKEIQAYGFSR